MKKVSFLLSVLLVCSLLITSCTKNDNESSTDVTTDVADDIASSIGSSNSGLSSELVETSDISGTQASAKNFMLSKDFIVKSVADTLYKTDTTITFTNPSGSSYSFSYVYHMIYGYVYSTGGLSNFYCNNTINGSYNGTVISSSESRKGNWIVTGLSASSSEYILNGTSVREGSSQSKIHNKSSISSNSTITVTNVTVNKSSLQITGGTLTWSITGTVNGTSFNYSAVVTYLGNREAQLVINGKTYLINLTTGQIK